MYHPGPPPQGGQKSKVGRNLAGCGCGLILCLVLLGGCLAALDSGDSTTASSTSSTSPSPTTPSTEPDETGTSATPLPTPSVTRSPRRTKRPAVSRKPTPRPRKRTVRKPPEPAPVYYRNCAAVRAAGKAPIHQGEPGYARHLDRDGDGVGCE
ncbi:excalibur calcium-binding domain-containing protein [Actinomadura sp. NEAU-AAG7]|uniref:excalibur calcium-binding domain-containing protein n=1 Tax=Actinomadura sp. NEAU-AAG7 TaxID=2839640 RepID=UPI001BE40A15|nr:excalibur calcium-binding domain-containing protein [Actinomadura sp. NEAU-AAG7]MBT2214164.1 excalibur calcium-binding domain-containing protein [Actinomadura sp. NEAU-AAG7]